MDKKIQLAIDQVSDDVLKKHFPGIHADSSLLGIQGSETKDVKKRQVKKKKTPEKVEEEGEKPEEKKEEEVREEPVPDNEETKKSEEKTDWSTPQKINDYIKTQKSDYDITVEEIEKKPDLSTPEGRNKAIKFEESDEDAFTRKLNLEIREKRENVENLKKELDEARREYAEMDYKKRKMWTRVKNYFGNILGKSWQERRRDNIKKDEKGVIRDDEVLYLEAIYKNKLFDYKNVLLGEIFSGGLPEEEKKKKLAETVNYFGKNEFVQLGQSRDDARAEQLKKDPSLFQAIGSGFSNIEKYYYKLPKVVRYSIGIGALASGVGAIMIGKRALSGFLLGYSTYRGGAGLDNLVTGWKDNKYQKRTLRDFENRDDQYKFLSESLNNKLFNVDERLHGRDWRKLGYATVGAVLGTLVGTGKAAEAIRWISGNVDFGEIPEKFQSLAGKIREILGKTMADAYPAAENLSVSGIEDQLGDTGKELSGSLKKLMTERGSSLQGTLGDYLEKNPGLMDKYNQLAGGRHFNAGQIAQRMYSDYIKGSGNPLNKSLDLVYQGTEIEIDPGTLKITGIEDARGTIARVIKQVGESRENWANIKNLSIDDLSGNAKQKIMSLANKYSEFWGAESKIKKGEIIKNWATRIARLAIEKK
jgi:hypothetical protein